MDNEPVQHKVFGHYTIGIEQSDDEALSKNTYHISVNNPQHDSAASAALLKQIQTAMGGMFTFGQIKTDKAGDSFVTHMLCNAPENMHPDKVTELFNAQIPSLKEPKKIDPIIALHDTLEQLKIPPAQAAEIVRTFNAKLQQSPNTGYSV